ncbi:atilla isoform b-related-related [Holotrichia oblita]|uniref:Atilla isoform b-related-related n=1 Tax=Holotrichia oblita TaxID=644536 RepID=A0ACB9SNR6_HOLOL|nr:atilla isoform b-related-related [Holotrichia oblita]
MCGKQQEDQNKCYQRSGFGGRQVVCACDQEGCNASSTIYISTALLIGALLLGKLSM